LPPPDFARRTVNHKNGVKLDNRVENLEWATYRENNEHARDTGLCRQHGSNTNLSKYDEALIAAMRRTHAEYKPTYRKLGELFGMSTIHAWEVIVGKSRKRG
jgi:hypothetical protein